MSEKSEEIKKEAGKTTCQFCGKEIDGKTCFKYLNERHQQVAIPDLCWDEKCIETYEDHYADCEPNYQEIEERWTDAKDQLWEESALWKGD